MRKISTFIMMLVGLQIMFAQVTIENNRLVKDGKSYKFSEYPSVFSNAEAKNYFKKARRNGTTGMILSTTGGALLGFSVARALTTPKETQMKSPFGDTITIEGSRGMWWQYAGLGGGIALASIPFALWADKNAKEAIAAENGETTAFKPYFEVKSAGTAIALSYNF